MSFKQVIQTHHLEYQRKDEVEKKVGKTVLLYKGEHWAITQLQRRKNISKGFLKALEFWISNVKSSAIELSRIDCVKDTAQDIKK
jgi:hypothetical protein